jgi:predicted esterase
MVCVLALHGFGQTAVGLKGRLNALVRVLKCELVCCEAPHALDSSERGRAWWRASDESPPCYQGINESIDFVLGFIREHGPFDILLGFSQGACLAAALVLTHPEIELKGVILAGGFVPRDPVVCGKLLVPGEIPSLHIIGNKDEIVPPEGSIALSKLFLDPQIVRHEGGHFIPTASEYAQQYRSFVAKVLSVEHKL